MGEDPRRRGVKYLSTMRYVSCAEVTSRAFLFSSALLSSHSLASRLPGGRMGIELLKGKKAWEEGGT